MIGEAEARGRRACAWYKAQRAYFDAVVLTLDEGEGEALRCIALRYLDGQPNGEIMQRLCRRNLSSLLRRGFAELGRRLPPGPWDEGGADCKTADSGTDGKAAVRLL